MSYEGIKPLDNSLTGEYRNFLYPKLYEMAGERLSVKRGAKNENKINTNT